MIGLSARTGHRYPAGMTKKPRRIFMIAYEGCQILDVTGPMQMFAGANDELDSPNYVLKLVAPSEGPFTTSSGLNLVANHALSNIDETDLTSNDTVLVSGGDPGLPAMLEAGDIARFVRAAHFQGARIASICTGTFFLAAAGLIDNKRAATHWASVDRLRRFRPAVDVDPEALFINDGNIWSSAGVTAGIDLALALIDADHNRAVALAVAQRHVVYRIRPGGQSQFSSELAAQTAGDPRLRKLAEQISQRPDRNWRSEFLASEIGVSLRSLTRLFRRELNASPSEFVERIRIDQARRALLETDARIETVAHRCGFGSLRRMDRAFARNISATPSEFRARFRPNGKPAHTQQGSTR